MNIKSSMWACAAAFFLIALAGASPAFSQDSQDEPPTAAVESAGSQPSETSQLEDGTLFRGEHAPRQMLHRRPPSPDVWTTLRPSFTDASLAWLAVIVIFVLTIQSRPRVSLHNFDTVVLAFTCLLLLFRANTSALPRDPTGRTMQFWVYTLLALFAVYWMVRGYRLLAARSIPAFIPNVSPNALAVLTLAGLLIALNTIVTAPLSAGSRDGIAGGVCLAETGKLPYGDAAGRDVRSPLVYALHAGALKVWKPTIDENGVAWANRDTWLQGDALKRIDPTPAHLVNALLFVLMFSGLACLGHRLHSMSMGLGIATIFCVFPGTIECLNRPEVMLPAALVTWSLAFLTLPVMGGLLAAFAMALAGLAWPWAWLLLPALLAYFFRHGWQGFGAIVGTLAGAAACGAIILCLTAPSLPRSDGSLEAAGAQPKYTALLSGNNEVVINASNNPEPIERDAMKNFFWNALLNVDSVRLDTRESPTTLPPGVDATTILYREIEPTGAAAEPLVRGYRHAMSGQPFGPRLAAALRTVVEATWMPEIPPELPMASPWAVWPGPTREHSFIVARRATKVAVVVLGVLTMWPLLRRNRPVPQPHQALGALLGVGAAILLASEMGAAGNLVWLMPLLLGAMAARALVVPVPPPPPAGPLQRPGVGTFTSAPVPRITVEN